MIELLAAGGSLLGGLFGRSSANRAANVQAQAAREATELNREIFDTTSGYFAPYREAGANALRAYQGAVGTDFTQSPGYEFRLGEGMRAIEGSAAARGNLMSGSTLQALQRYGQDYATNEYGNWLNRLGGIMQQGQASAGMQANLGQNFAANQGNILAQGANAQAAGIMGGANAMTQGINNAFGTYNYMRNIQPNLYGGS